MPSGVYIKTQEHKARLSAALKGIRVPPEVLIKRLGRKQSAETIEKRVCQLRGKHYNAGRSHTTEERKKISAANKGRQFTLGHTLTPEHKEKIRKGIKAAWERGALGNPSWLKKVLDGMQVRPTKPEKELLDILTEHFPGAFAYNGDFSQGVMLNHLVPDFVNVNGHKQVIEVFGEPFHDPAKAWKPIRYVATAVGRTQAYDKIGYQCLILWQAEFTHTAAIIDKLREFIRGDSIQVVVEGKGP